MTVEKIQQGTVPTNEHLVTFSFVPVRIDHGSFVLVENELEYFKLLNDEIHTLSRAFTTREAVVDTLLTYKSALSTAMPLKESIPSREHLETLRDLLSFTASQPSTSTVLNTPLAELVFQGLYIEFDRKHNSGGQKISVDVDTLCINELRMNASTDIAGATNKGTTSPRSPEDIIHNSSSKTSYSGDRGGMQKTQSLFASKNLVAPRLNDHEDGISVKTQQLKYRQYDVGNLRKCDVFIANSSLILNLPVILSVVGYFLETITLGYMRNNAWLNSEDEGPYDFRRALDVEVHASDLCLTLPDSDNLDASALCAVINLYYSQCWRGFTTVGPAKTTTFADIEVLQVFMAHLSNVKESFAKSIINSFRIHILRQHNVIPSEDAFEHNSAVLAKRGTIGRHLSLSPQTLSIPRTETPSIIQHLEISIVPCSSLSTTQMPLFSSMAPSPFAATIPDETKWSQQQAALIFLKVSVNDIAFISRTVGHMTAQLKSRICPPPLEESYINLLVNFDDINHLPKQTFFHRHAPILTPVELRSTETNLKPFLLEVVIHNNTYNVDIIKSSLSLRQLHHTKYKDGNHAAFGFIMEAWLLNDEIGEWEPLIEQMDITFVSSVNEVKVETPKQNPNRGGNGDGNEDNDVAADANTNSITTNTPTKPAKFKELLRFDLHALPIEISISHAGLVGILRFFFLLFL